MKIYVADIGNFVVTAENDIERVILREFLLKLDEKPKRHVFHLHSYGRQSGHVGYDHFNFGFYTFKDGRCWTNVQANTELEQFC